MTKKILYFVTEDWYFVSHRLPLAIAARAAGYDVTVVTRVREHGSTIINAGLRLIPLELRRRGMNPFIEFALLMRLITLYRSERPDIAHHVAMKPVLYGSLAALAARTPHVVNALAGLGWLFTSNSPTARLLGAVVRALFSFLLKRGSVIVQNPDDARWLMEQGVPAQNIHLIRGSGVDVKLFTPQPESEGDPVVMLASRLLWDKGVAEFVEAARRLQTSGQRARFVLVGDTDPENPASIRPARLDGWRREGIVEWWGRRDDMPDVLVQASIVCLPSYREGLPKVLVEAAACGRAIVAADVPGCREIVHEGENGLRVPVRNAGALATAIRQLLDDAAMRRRMGGRGRALVEAEFSVEKVVAETLSLYRQLLESKAVGG
ncbi:MAG TPA: glycosyltransferase family 4 protein [Gammaproteobacteria bacterium]|nr:glycosyltransferase family 4 protein [Gammaproteobacteria bacterium]